MDASPSKDEDAGEDSGKDTGTEYEPDAGKDAGKSPPTVWYDPISNLTWQNVPTEVGSKWKSAKDYCSNLDLEGGGWRLPSISELRSLLRGCPSTEIGGECEVCDECLGEACWNNGCDGCKYGYGPALGCFWDEDLCGPCGGYWSSSSYKDNVDYAWNVHYGLGRVAGFPKNSVKNAVRCVRGETSTVDTGLDDAGPGGIDAGK